MGGELGNETKVDLLWSSTMSPTNFALIENDDLITNSVFKKLVFLSLCQYLKIESNHEHVIIFHMPGTFFCLSHMQ